MDRGALRARSRSLWGAGARGVHVQRCLAKGPRRTAFQTQRASVKKKGCVKWQLSETWTFSFVCVGFHVVANLALQLFLAGKTAHPPQPPARGVHVQTGCFQI